MKILHPTDFSECAALAQATAVDLAGKLGGEIVLLQVLVETPLYGETVLNMPKVQSVYDAQRKWAEATLEARAADLRQRGIKTSWRAQAGVPFEEIVRVAEGEHVDMIVMGTHGRSGLNRALLGSVAERVIRLAPCPVLTVRQAKSEAGR
ncbi:MAG TPA: universal stress protein [Methylomirabilota bacterium]|jgi:nucleotide-binding universal stress UspA family protein